MANLTKNQKIKVTRIIISSLFGLFSIFALIVSIYSLIVSMGVREDYRKVEGLDLEPEIRFLLSPGIPQSFSISNLGRTEAIQVVVRFILYTYNQESKKIGTIFCGDKEHIFTIKELSPLETKTFEFSLIQSLSDRGMVIPKGNYAVEVIIAYTKNPDRKFFMRRGIYFIDSEGMWWNERFEHTKSEEYEKIKNNILNEPILSCNSYDVLNKINLDTVQFR